MEVEAEVVTRIIEFSASNKFLVLLLTAVLLVVATWCIKRTPLDAIPDLSDTQVIIYSRWDRSPDIIEDQVTYPIISALLGAPKVKAVRGFSDFGFSYVYVIFEDGTDLYWARSRVLEYLSKIQARLPEEVKTEIGPDATSVGWVYQYALIDETGGKNLSELRSIQDWQLKYLLQSVPGVAEVASIGGFVKQYQIVVDPNRLAAYNISLLDLTEAVRNGNAETGGRVIEFGDREYMIRGRGYVKSIDDIKEIVVSVEPKTGVPILVKNIARVELGPDIRRGVADLDGRGDTVGGIVVMRQSENVLNVIDRVKERIKEIEPSLPHGVKIVPVYDRSDLVKAAIDTLTHELVLEVIIVSLVILHFLWHFPSAIVPIATIPISVFLAFIPMYLMGLTSNIMSLAGIAISIGVLVDGAIVEVENAYKRLEEWQSSGRKGDFHEVRLSALKEVGPSVFFSLLLIAVSFLPIFTLVDQEGRLFTPLAMSKTLAMALAALLAVTLDPALRMLFTRMDPFTFSPLWLSRICTSIFVGRYYPEEKHPISRRLIAFYEPIVRWSLNNPRKVLVGAALLVATTIPVYFKLGSEFMPPLNEGAFLYMPTALPGMSVTEAKRVIQQQDKIIKEFPEVQSVFGKAGRAETPTDPAPFSMVETTVVLKPTSEWPAVARWYSDLPKALHFLFAWITPPHRTFEELQAAMDAKLKFAGIPNIWTMPIKNRIDMLSTGIRTPVGIKVLGDDLTVIQQVSEDVERVVRTVSGARNVVAERVADGYYLDIVLDRVALARYGVSIAEAQMVMASAIGGENITTTVEGRERYPVNVRYDRAYREDISALRRVLLPTPSGAHIPLEQVAKIEMLEGPSMIRNDQGLRVGYIYVDVANRDIGSFLNDARAAVGSQVKLPPGYVLQWSGQYENMQRVKERLTFIVPLTIILIGLLLYVNTGSVFSTGLVLLAVPFSLVGAVWLLFILDYHISIAVWVGMIALMGLDAETGVFMLMYLDLSRNEAKAKGKLNSVEDFREAVVHGAAQRIRPKMMTVLAAFMGLVPIMFSTGAGADVMRRIATPMIGGLATSFILELLVYPPAYYLWWRHKHR